MGSENPIGADNQQERPDIEEWTVGFVDGEHDSSHRQPLRRFSVKRRSDVMERVVPFFEERPLRTAKQLDFERFRADLQIMQSGRHLQESGLREFARITETMNRRQRSRYLESSETIRRPTRTTSS